MIKYIISDSKHYFSLELGIHHINPTIMKKIHIILFAFLSLLDGIGQVTEIDYFGQTPPGDSAIVFAPDFISLPDRYNQNGSFTPDGKEFCFTVTNSGWTNCDIYYTKIE